MRPAYEPTETLRVRVPRRLVTAVAEAAERDCKTVSEFARQALLAAARSAGVPVKRKGAPMADDTISIQVEGEQTGDRDRRTIAEINAEADMWAESCGISA
jgi:hypothetical protein